MTFIDIAPGRAERPAAVQSGTSDALTCYKLALDTAREACEGQLATIAHSRGAQLATAKGLITAAIDQFTTAAEHPAADAG